MKEIEIIKLPLMGSPFSFKTRKQGRRDGIEFEIKQSDKVSIEILKRERYEKAKRLGSFLKDYSGNDLFLCSLQKQMKSKGLSRLTKRQIDIGYKLIKKSLQDLD